MTRKGPFFRVSVAETGETALGVVRMAVSGNGLVAIEIGGGETEFLQGLLDRGRQLGSEHADQAAAAAKQITEYLLGVRDHFHLAVDWSILSDFQARVLRVVQTIPYGETRTYGQVAVQVGKPGAARAVGRANATNPVPLLIPCHRVIAADGGLRGYGAGEGLKTKAWLLALEREGATT